MMRTLRRALRQWKREFLAFWGRFTAFHRIVIGILLAMGIVFLARTRVIDPLERDLATEHKTLADKGVPARVPAGRAKGRGGVESVPARRREGRCQRRAPGARRPAWAARPQERGGAGSGRRPGSDGDGGVGLRAGGTLCLDLRVSERCAAGAAPVGIARCLHCAGERERRVRRLRRASAAAAVHAGSASLPSICPRLPSARPPFRGCLPVWPGVMDSCRLPWRTIR